jgi:hypothetical protein
MDAQRQKAIAAEIGDVYRAYLSAFAAAMWRDLTQNQRTAPGALAFWAFPLLILGGAPDSATVRMIDEAHYDDMVRSTYVRFLADGWAGRVEAADDMQVIAASDDLAVLSARGARYRVDGSALSRWDTCYLMRRAPRGWRTFALANVTPTPAMADWAAWLAGLSRISG